MATEVLMSLIQLKFEGELNLGGGNKSLIGIILPC